MWEAKSKPLGHGMFRFPEAAALFLGWKTVRVRPLEPLKND